MLRSLMLRCAQRRRTSYFSISATAPPVGKQCKGERQWEGQPQTLDGVPQFAARRSNNAAPRESRPRSVGKNSCASTARVQAMQSCT